MTVLCDVFIEKLYSWYQLLDDNVYVSFKWIFLSLEFLKPIFIYSIMFIHVQDNARGKYKTKLNKK